MMLLLSFLLSANLQFSLQQIPTTELPELVLVAVEGVSTNLEITCGFDDMFGMEYWIINGIIYNLYVELIQNIALESLYTLRIPEVDICLDNSTYQCVILISPTEARIGRVTRLHVVKGKNATTTIWCKLYNFFYNWSGFSCLVFN